jgi:hypothetical protein
MTTGRAVGGRFATAPAHGTRLRRLTSVEHLPLPGPPSRRHIGKTTFSCVICALAHRRAAKLRA